MFGLALFDSWVSEHFLVLWLGSSLWAEDELYALLIPLDLTLAALVALWVLNKACCAP